MFLVQETRTRILVHETCIQVAHRTMQVSLADDTDERVTKF